MMRRMPQVPVAGSTARWLLGEQPPVTEHDGMRTFAQACVRRACLGVRSADFSNHAGARSPAVSTRRMIMRTILAAMLALSVLAAVTAPASAGHPDPRNPAVEIPDPSPN